MTPTQSRPIPTSVVLPDIRTGSAAGVVRRAGYGVRMI
jgi:hypothetical protein